MWPLAAAKPVSGAVRARTSAIPGVTALPSRPGARSRGRRPLPNDRQRKHARFTFTRPSRVRNGLAVGR